MRHSTKQSAGLDWLLDELVQRVPAARQAVVLSADGLLLGCSADLERADAEHLCALAAGFSSLARGASRHVDGGPVRQTVVEMESAYLFVTAAGQGACLAVVSDADADIGLVAYEMAMLVIRVGESLSAPARSSAGAGDAD
ncbi:MULTISPECIES: roadblock/LC7 domain-containing protein [unclassified Micromonospora]|uniref:roadblock/LC7 domain-containing protein n=1 Tax=unclassified Micromonospora TaxID=2617518 RepID=UPI00249C5E77|nr:MULTISPECIES: roadblock/LC7 domain-containing protein [unclassified Micromonospora]WFE52124.1 roadblock/LC7 domain-containing protein [Micromonospora sp. WMMD1155]WFF01111.1 roadblock/LC7 domain-containing protein [Micromonospora sp. WMMD964]